MNEREKFRQPPKPLNSDEYTTLHFAASAGNEKAVALLIQHKADVNADGGAGWTPLHVAAQRGNVDVVKMLVKAGAKVDAKTAPLPGGPLPGAGPNTPPVILPPVQARTPLDVATDAKKTEVVEDLKSLKK
ncbi:MAG: ankyrin repeat domain-containing protein [Planctomycetia bacterium]|nr:ankyrin repeat domain-containing protein [Planctomycetia bacterium]